MSRQSLRQLHTFHGGLHLEGYKHLSNERPVVKLPLPPELILPLQQHIGQPAKPVVKAGDHVLKGEMIARAEGYVSVPLHAPTSGTIIAIEDRPVPHPSGLSAPAIILASDGEDRAIEPLPPLDAREIDPATLRQRIRDAGIVGLGGAGFPSFIKLNPGARTAIDTLVLNAAECEPYITCDDRLLREEADRVIAGARIMRHALQARHCVIAVEDNKPAAIAALRHHLPAGDSQDIEVVVIPTLYPTGGEKQLIRVITGIEIPSGGLPIDSGVVCHNIATAAATARAMLNGEPLTSRIVTVTGTAITAPQNFLAPIGTPIHHLISAAGGLLPQASNLPPDLISGGPMMGFRLQSDQIPITKTTNCLLIMPHAHEANPSPCIRCGECARVCPAQLLPQQLYWHARSREFDKIQEYNLFDCIECGCCSYVCPANLPLVHYYRFAKTTIWASERERRAADLARDRHEFRQFRLERDKQEKAEKLKKRAAESLANDDAKRAAIEAALARAKAKAATTEQIPPPPPAETTA
jgi:Na+-translocating ferredoxin:NAD+ oxidoreductase subunit C